jgi:hypothetical protein
MARSSRKPPTLFIIGGAEDRVGKATVLRRFVRLAGGRRSRVVIIPTASSFQNEVVEAYTEVFNRLGATDLSVVNPETRLDSHDDEAVALVDRATGIFMSGGSQLKLSQRDDHIRAKVQEWEGKKLPAGLVAEAEQIMLADDEQEAVLELSEGTGAKAKKVELSASGIVERLMDMLPEHLDLTDEPVTPKQQTGKAPKQEVPEAETLSREERSYRAARFLFGAEQAAKDLGLSEDKADEFEKRAVEAEKEQDDDDNDNED